MAAGKHSRHIRALGYTSVFILPSEMFVRSTVRAMVNVPTNRRRLFATLLSEEERTGALTKLAATSGPFKWQQVADRNAIQKSFLFQDFSACWSFMSRCALLAEKMWVFQQLQRCWCWSTVSSSRSPLHPYKTRDHHPEWFNVYNNVEVTLTTHDCGGVSELDISMAEKMDEFAADLLPNRS